MKIFSVGNYQTQAQMQTQIQNHKNVNNGNSLTFGMRILNFSNGPLKPGEKYLGQVTHSMFSREPGWDLHIFKILRNRNLGWYKVAVDETEGKEFINLINQNNYQGVEDKITSGLSSITS